MEQEIKSQLVLDIETTGLHPWYGDRITCMCAKEIVTGDKFLLCNEDESHILRQFIDFLRKYKHSETMLITANGTDFDIPFILTRITVNKLNIIVPDDHITYISKLLHFDIDNDITKKRISLNDIAALYGLGKKTANGLQAIEWWKNKEYDKIV